MAVAVEVPKLGNTVEECLIAKWRKHKGEAVSAGQVVAEIETAKATFEVTAHDCPSPQHLSPDILHLTTETPTQSFFPTFHQRPTTYQTRDSRAQSFLPTYHLPHTNYLGRSG